MPSTRDKRLSPEVLQLLCGPEDGEDPVALRLALVWEDMVVEERQVPLDEGMDLESGEIHTWSEGPATRVAQVVRVARPVVPELLDLRLVWIAALVSGALALLLSRLEPAPKHELVEIPDRFVDLLLEESALPVDDGGLVLRQAGVLGVIDRARPGATPSGTFVPPPPEEPAPWRQWFPESFLWQPLVETGPEGVARVDVPVPDSLTRWRVLALAHDERGHQAGAVHHFASTLPAYVDPVVPGWLFSGDEVVLPVTAVNRTGRPVGADLAVAAHGPLSGALDRDVLVPAHGTLLARIPLVVRGAGTGKVEATLGRTDRVVRSVPVSPTGRPVRQVRGGLLSSERRLELQGPPGADPATQVLTVTAFAGPAAVVHAEVERASRDASSGAYGFSVSSAARALPVPGDATAIRTLDVLAWQRLVRLARTPTPGQATDLVAALRPVEQHALVERIRPRLVRQVVEAQRPDGTWARQRGSSLQQVLVQTAWAARALPEAEEGARLRASGAVERHLASVDDAYTAAVLLASGLVPVSRVAALRGLVVEAVVERPDGSRVLGTSPGARTPWGTRPTSTEATAWAWLALEGVAWRGDLVAGLVERYDRGFGAGPANHVVLEAVTRALPGLTGELDVVLTDGGAEVARAAVSPGEPAVLSAPWESGLVLHAEPSVPGLVFTASLDSWVPWTREEGLPGVEVVASVPRLRVGHPGRVLLEVAGPAGEAVTIAQGLPAGAVVDEGALAGCSLLAAATVHPDRVELTTRPFQAGEVMEVPLDVTPAFEGTFSTAPLEVRLGSRSAQLAPLAWRVSR